MRFGFLLPAWLAFAGIIPVARAAAVGSGDVLLTDQLASRIVVLSAQTGKRSVLPTTPLPPYPAGLALSRQGELFVSAFGGIVRLDLGTGTWNWIATTTAAFDWYGSLTIDLDGALLAVDPAGNRTVVRIDPASGAITPLLSGTASFRPIGIAVLESGVIMVTAGASIYRYDRVRHQLRLFVTVTDLIATTSLVYVPSLHRLAVGGGAQLLDTGAVVLYDTVTGARLAKLPFEPPGQIAVARDGGFLFGIGGGEVWHWAPNLTTDRPVSCFQPGDDFDPQCMGRYTGFAVVDAPVPARARSWGRLKAMYR